MWVLCLEFSTLSDNSYLLSGVVPFDPRTSHPLLYLACLSDICAVAWSLVEGGPRHGVCLHNSTINSMPMLSKAATIAIRYATERRQGSIGPDRLEKRTISHFAHIIPSLRFHLVGKSTHLFVDYLPSSSRLHSILHTKASTFTKMTEDLKRGDASLLAEIRATTSGLKVYVSTNTANDIEVARWEDMAIVHSQAWESFMRIILRLPQSKGTTLCSTGRLCVRLWKYIVDYSRRRSLRVTCCLLSHSMSSTNLPI